MKASVTIRLKSGVLDPEGKAIHQALSNLGFAEVNAVRQSRVIELDLAETDIQAAERRVQAMCQQLLANTVIEAYSVQIDVGA